MAIYLKKFETTSQYNAYTASTEFITPNVSICEDEPTAVHYNPYVEQPQPNNTIIYAASAKLPETTSNKTGGLHTNAFNTTIASHTFENGVGTIEFNDDVTTIGDYAFYQCSSLTSISIPDSVTSIGTYTFMDCSGLTSIDMPDSVTSIGNNAFTNCSGMTSCTIGSGVTSIGNTAFGACTGLTSIDIPNSVTSIGGNAFYSCSGLIRITSNATTAPRISNDTFRGVKTGGILTVPSGSSGYDVWMGTGDYYLGKYNWTKVEQ